MSITRMIYDQYSRYQACADLLKKLGINTDNTILDVGSGPECLFKVFVPDNNISFVDPLISESADEHYIHGNVFSEQLDNKSFDCITSIDVYEHIPPEYRKAFLERITALSQSFLVLAFPTSDTTEAQEVDNTINDYYREFTGRDYSWLEEHIHYGLPSLQETVTQLENLGWHCQTIGHGHAPWIKDYLSFIVCLWDSEGLQDNILQMSEKFNEYLYPYEFCPPFYREFIIASRHPIPNIAINTDDLDLEQGNQQFQQLMYELYEKNCVAMMKEVNKHSAIFKNLNQDIAELNRIIKETSEWGTSLNQTVTIRDKEIYRLSDELFKANTELFTIKASKSWKLIQAANGILWIIKNRQLSDRDKVYAQKLIRVIYNKIPTPLQKLIRLSYQQLIIKPKKFLTKLKVFKYPDFIPIRQQSGFADYIFFGVIDWHFRHQRPQQLALALAEAGHRVFYISVLFVDDERNGFKAEDLSYQHNLFQIKLFVKNSPSVYAAAPDIEALAQLKASLGAMLNWAECGQVVALVQHPFWCDVAMAVPNSHLVYDCMDYHEGFGNNGESLVQLEKTLFIESDLTITTSDYLDNAVAKYTHKRVLIRNAGEYSHFSVKPPVIYQDPQGRRIIGYYGAIAEWFDTDLIEAVAKQFHNCCILLVGRDTVNLKAAVKHLPNIIFTDEVEYQKLPFYLYSFDLCLLPFKVIPLTLATNPVKVYEYLSAGKPVVSVALPEMMQFGDLVYTADTTEKFLSHIAKLLHEPEANTLIEQRQAFAKQQTWQQRAEVLIQEAENHLIEPKVSIIVVTYNNIALTKACLQSIDEYSQYDNLEIIVVDNNSTDESKTYLSQWHIEKDNRRLILNDQNLGFSAANNQGLKIATGDYLVLLNNDTHVTCGWVRTLVNHLKHHPDIGLIGPVTNNIGNEAKIDIYYKDMAEMLIKAKAYTDRHIGQLYPMRTVAFFCVMMNRATFEKVGYLDEAFGLGFFEDDDYCRRIEQQQLKIVCADDVFIHHQLSASFDKLKQEQKQKLFVENKKIYEAKWGEWIPHCYRSAQNNSFIPTKFAKHKFIQGICNICGEKTRFFFLEQKRFFFFR